MYSSVVLGVENYKFEELIENYKLTKGVLLDTDLDENDWNNLIKDFKSLVKNKTKKEFPQNVKDQLIGAICAVFLSWESNRAKVYRKLNQIPSDWGTAVNVQSMVFGNMGDDCSTGVVFTRNPSNGAKDIYGEYLINAQGEDVVAGTRTPQHITKKARNELKTKKTINGRGNAFCIQKTQRNFIQARKDTTKICKMLNLQLKIKFCGFCKLDQEKELQNQLLRLQ